jgi:heat shock protein HslJ
MNHIYSVILPLALTALVVSGCSSGPMTPTSPSSIAGSTALTADALSTTWRLHSIQPAGQAEQASPAGADYTLTFTDRLSLRADCNTCSTSYTISGSTISVAEVMACTRAFCPTAAFERDYTSLMNGDFTVTSTGSSMTWSSPRGTIRFAR